MGEHDVIVIGAGLSGLVCARRLQEAGQRVAVVEARDRVGGRTWSKALGEGIFDLGGQWLGPGQRRVATLADQLGVETFPTYCEGRHVFCGKGRRTTYHGTIPRIALRGLAGLGLSIARLELLMRRISVSEPWSARGAAELDARTGASVVDGWIQPEGRASFDVAVKTIFGAEPADLSLLFMAWYTKAGEGFFNLVDVRGGAQERRFVRGAQALSLALADQLGRTHLYLEAPVDVVGETAGGVVVRSGDRSFEARRVVVALPPPQVAKIRFEPELPAARQRLVEAARMGSAIKVHALYPRAFWRDAGLSGEAVFEEGPLSVMFDNSSHDGAQPALVGFIMANDVEIWRTVDAETRRSAVLESLRRAFGVDALSPSHYLEQDWCAEPYTGGCPVALLPAGILSGSGPAVREPCRRVHWAGTETATHYPGYLEGAIEAGERAAREVTDRLRD